MRKRSTHPVFPREKGPLAERPFAKTDVEGSFGVVLLKGSLCRWKRVAALMAVKCPSGLDGNKGGTASARPSRRTDAFLLQL